MKFKPCLLWHTWSVAVWVVRVTFELSVAFSCISSAVDLGKHLTNMIEIMPKPFVNFSNIVKALTFSGIKAGAVNFYFLQMLTEAETLLLYSPGCINSFYICSCSHSINTISLILFWHLPFCALLLPQMHQSSRPLLKTMVLPVHKAIKDTTALTVKVTGRM